MGRPSPPLKASMPRPCLILISLQGHVPRPRWGRVNGCWPQPQGGEVRAVAGRGRKALQPQVPATGPQQEPASQAGFHPPLSTLPTATASLHLSPKAELTVLGSECPPHSSLMCTVTCWGSLKNKGLQVSCVWQCVGPSSTPVKVFVPLLVSRPLKSVSILERK